MTNYGQGTTSNREPDVIDSDEDPEYVTNILGLPNIDAFKIQLQEEFNAMVESVEKYGGFYIGRYEINNFAEELGHEPVIMKDSIVTNYYIAWYYEYQNTKLIKANENVETTMIWGSMWDRTLIWLAETNEESGGLYGKSYSEIYDSSGWGNYPSTLSITTRAPDPAPMWKAGQNELWKANNIYDLAGNAGDWTLEATEADYRVYRGGFNVSWSDDKSVSEREYSGAGNINVNYYSSRTAMYIK